MNGHLVIIDYNGTIIFHVRNLNFEVARKSATTAKLFYLENFSKYGIHNIPIDDILTFVDPRIVVCTL